MTELLVLPQWAESREAARAETAQRTVEAIQQLFHDIAEPVIAACKRIMTYIADALKPMIQIVVQVGRSLGLVQRRSKRSSRGLKVQAKRKRLGLTVSGHYAHPYLHKLYPTRKQAYADALAWERYGQ